MKGCGRCEQRRWVLWILVRHFQQKTVEMLKLVGSRAGGQAGLVGRDNVIAGTDWGLGTRVGHPKNAWAKFKAMAEGARLATARLWKR